MSTADQLSPIPRPCLEDLVQHALRELRQARQLGDTAQATRSERRMNAMLDQLAKRVWLPDMSPARETVRA